MKKSLIIALALFLGIFIATSSAVEVTRFGPKQYVRDNGKPQTVTDTFPAEAGVGTLIVENGDADHHHQVSHVKITLNGKMVFGPWVFDRHGKHNKHRVHLSENNTLSVRVDGRPGSHITVTIIQDVKPPSTAVEVTRFGPKQYVCEKGKPQTVTDTFSAYAGAAKIIVVNGEEHQHQGGRDEHRDQRDRDEDADHKGWDEDANHRVSSAIITLNGKEVFGPRDFKRHRSHLEADVNLLVNNTLSVKLHGRPGSYLTITIMQMVIPPTASITAAPDAIILGNASTLTWTSTNAEQVTIDSGIGEVDQSGSLEVTPQETTTYTITATNDGGTATDSATITVTNPYPTVEITANPAIIAKGGSTTLTWTSLNCQSASIDNGVGTVPLTGSVTVYPAATTTYTITISGPLGVANAKATVAVQAPIEPQPEGSFGDEYKDLIPPDSSAGTYDAKRFSVVTGLVHNQAGASLANVAVTCLGHPEYGTALTDAQGRYSLPVEGGSVMTVACQQQGLITAHRQVNVPWNDIAVVETMVMIPYDQKATTVTFDGNANIVVTHQSTAVSDQWAPALPPRSLPVTTRPISWTKTATPSSN
jgi:hypothetical protein